MKGIYKITSPSNKFYIGSSNDIKIRKKNHFNNLKKNKHSNIHLQRSFNKYGIENFKFEIIEECEVDKLIEREQYYIDNLKPEYNICPIAGSQIGRIISKETRLKMSDSQKKRKREDKSGRKVVMIDIDTNEEIQVFDSITKASDYLNKGKSGVVNIHGVCKPSFRFSAYGYKWKYLDENI